MLPAHAARPLPTYLHDLLSQIEQLVALWVHHAAKQVVVLVNTLQHHTDLHDTQSSDRVAAALPHTDAPTVRKV